MSVTCNSVHSWFELTVFREDAQLSYEAALASSIDKLTCVPSLRACHCHIAMGCILSSDSKSQLTNTSAPVKKTPSTEAHSTTELASP
eukprot:2396510-Amphidinium_carterae.1